MASYLVCEKPKDEYTRKILENLYVFAQAAVSQIVHEEDKLKTLETAQLLPAVKEIDLATFAERFIVYTKNFKATLYELGIKIPLLSYGNNEIKIICKSIPLNQALLAKLRKIEFERIKITNLSGGLFDIDFN
jgi:hypothetical protein